MTIVYEGNGQMNTNLAWEQPSAYSTQNNNNTNTLASIDIYEV